MLGFRKHWSTLWTKQLIYADRQMSLLSGSGSGQWTSVFTTQTWSAGEHHRHPERTRFSSLRWWVWKKLQIMLSCDRQDEEEEEEEEDEDQYFSDSWGIWNGCLSCFMTTRAQTGSLWAWPQLCRRSDPISIYCTASLRELYDQPLWYCRKFPVQSLSKSV